MTQKTFIHIEDGEAAAFGRGATSPSAQASAAGSQVIPFIPNSRPSAAALLALEDATLPSTFESVGEVAVRLVGSWSLPRISCRSAAWEEDSADLLPSRP